jgi:hypothetical protein
MLTEIARARARPKTRDELQVFMARPSTISKWYDGEIA